ncbi:transposase [Rickettsia endosymbiont of Culicoides newsteadi]|nr:transposase [Rickettsia endosymbiont of Culicoides newsteadi]
MQEDAEDIALEESFKEGEAKGKAEGKITMAKKMLAKRKPIDEIIEFTELTIEEIKVLKKEIEQSKKNSL